MNVRRQGASEASFFAWPGGSERASVVTVAVTSACGASVASFFSWPGGSDEAVTTVVGGVERASFFAWPGGSDDVPVSFFA